MSHSNANPEERYAAVVETFLGDAEATDGTSVGKGFGASALKINNKIFAMLVQGTLVVKLPVERVDALIAARVGERFDPGHGRPMREWLTVDPASEVDWLALAREARTFVGSTFAS
jgi:hypothetical protein